MQSPVLAILSILYLLSGVSRVVAANVYNIIVRDGYRYEDGDMENYYNGLTTGEAMEIDGGEKNGEMEKLDQPGLVVPGNSYTVDQKSCGCRQVIISSQGAAQRLQPWAMGIYRTYPAVYNGRPAYKGPGTLRMYYEPFWGWMVSDFLGDSANQNIYNRSKASPCVYELPETWMYYDYQNKHWAHDSTLVVRCIQATLPGPQTASPQAGSLLSPPHHFYNYHLPLTGQSQPQSG